MSLGRWVLVQAVLVVAGLCVGELVPEGTAQEVVFRTRGRGMPRADAALIRVLERGNYRVIARDSVLMADEVIEGDIILVRAALRVEGRIAGDLIGVQADIFARPGGRFDGVVAVLGGGFYGSSLAMLGAAPINAAVYDYRVQRREDGVYVITAPGAKARLRLAGLYGFLLPSYDRVNAVTVPWGVEFERGASTWLPDASGRIRYRSVRTDVDGDLELRWSLGRHSLALRGGLTVRTNDDWINADVENSIYAIVAGIDTRNYYEAGFAEAGLELEFGQGAQWSAGLTVGWERADSLSNRDPFSIFSIRGGFRPNASVEVADAVGAELVLGVQATPGNAASVNVDVNVERADRGVAGDLTFTVFGGSLAADIPTIGAQTLLIAARGQVPGSEGAPGQRWRALGGWGSLPTLRPVERQGDVMWWAGATYRVPLRPQAGLLARLDVWLQYAAGNAWVDGGTRPPTVHNLGLGVSLGPLAGGVFTEPSADYRTVIALGIDVRR